MIQAIRKHIVAILIVTVVSACISIYWDYSQVRVSRIIDGDTFVMSDGTHIRLYGIDAPEKKQHFGQESTAHLSQKILGKTIKIIPKGKNHERIVGDVWYYQHHINTEMIEEGYAWHEIHYAAKKKDFEAAEKKAKNNKLGLWSESNPVPPWKFRHK